MVTVKYKEIIASTDDNPNMLRDLVSFVALLRTSWSSETSVDPNTWSLQNPALGQCAVTALVVNDYFGGDIVWSVAVLPSGEKQSHYFNYIGGLEIDFTREQFPVGTLLGIGVSRTNGFLTTRDYCLSYSETRKRYKLFKDRIAYNLTLDHVE